MPAFPRVKAAIFDLDDTLIDHSSALERAVDSVFELHGELQCHYLSANHFRYAWAAAHKAIYPRYLRNEITHEEQRILRVREIWGAAGIGLSDQECLAITDRFLEIYASHWAVFPDTIACLQSLGHLKLGIITNGWGRQQRAKLEKLGLQNYFSSILVSGEVGCAKPEKAIFAMACSELGVEPGEAAFAGDLYELDVVGAQNGGLVPIWVKRKEEGERSLEGVHCVSSLAELARLFPA